MASPLHQPPNLVAVPWAGLNDALRASQIRFFLRLPMSSLRCSPYFQFGHRTLITTERRQARDSGIIKVSGHQSVFAVPLRDWSDGRCYRGDGLRGDLVLLAERGIGRSGEHTVLRQEITVAEAQHGAPVTARDWLVQRHTGR